MTGNNPDKIYGPGMLWRIGAGFSALFMLVLFLGSLLHPYLGEEREPFLLFCGAPIGLVMTLGWAYLFVVSFQRVQILPDALILSKLGFRVGLPMEEITAVTQTERLIIATKNKTYRLHFPFRPTQTKLYQALQQHVPAARAAQTQQLTAPLPIIVKPRRMVQMVVTIYFLLGLAMAAFGVSGFWYVITSFSEIDWAQRIIIPPMGLFSIAIGGWMIYSFLWSFVWRYAFTNKVVRLRRALGVQSYPVAAIVDMEFKSEERTFKGVVRILYTLVLWLDDGRTVTISPNGAGMSSDYVEAEEKMILTELERQLRHHYDLGESPR
ncbi:MAG: hypothetical protein GY803_22880 [Chloroflexi bacterium]|nr:hypothetical protein [Chloroflexota bacterium]